MIIWRRELVKREAVDGWFEGNYYLSFLPGWRNWYTHQTQNLARFTSHVGSSPTLGTNFERLSRKWRKPLFVAII